MDYDTSVKTVFDFIYTTQECAEFINALEHALETKYDANLNIMETLMKHASYVAVKELEYLIKENGVQISDKNALAAYITDIIKDLKSAPVLNLTLSFFPTYKQIKDFANWWRQEVSPTSVIRIKVDHKILAGAVIEWQGHATPLTLQNAIDEILLNNNG